MKTFRIVESNGRYRVQRGHALDYIKPDMPTIWMDVSGRRHLFVSSARLELRQAIAADERRHRDNYPNVVETWTKVDEVVARPV